MKRRAILALVAVLALSSCGTHSSAPEPDSGHVVDGTATTVIRMPHGFRNVVVTCWHGNGIYVTSRGGTTDHPVGSGVYVVPRDPLCS